MNVVFDLCLDGPAYPGPLGHASVAYGEVWVGPLGLLGLLETSLGLTGSFCDAFERTTQLAHALKDRQGFWRQSFDVDPLATCERLLRDRDLLTMWGWQTQSGSPRLAELAAATALAPPGLPDRICDVASALAKHKPSFSSCTSFTSPEHLPPLWEKVLRAIEQSGVPVQWQNIVPTTPVGDLAACRSAGFTPAADGTLSLLRRHGPLDTADEVAAWLAAMPTLDSVVVVGADAVLDQALARHGLPVSGQGIGTAASTQLLNLIIETAFCPMDLGVLHALLTLDVSPIPRRLAADFCRALQRAPGRGSAEFRAAIADALVANDNDAELESRITHFVLPATLNTDGSLTLAALAARVDALATWARSRVNFAESLGALLGAIARFRSALAELSDLPLSRTLLRRLCAEATDLPWAFAEGQAGLVHVSQPGAILAPARTVVWWNFSRAQAPRAQRLFLTSSEADALQAQGFVVPGPPTMSARASAWRRPLLQATQQLVLACSTYDEAGEHAELHPLWDEIVATMSRAEAASRLVVTELLHPVPVAKKVVERQPLVLPAIAIKTAIPLLLREVESPSSLEMLLGCSLQWGLRYVARLSGGLSTPITPPFPLLAGTLAHELLAQVLQAAPRSEDEAAVLAAALFDGLSKDAYEPLNMAASQAERAEVRLAVVESARALVGLGLRHNAVLAGVELRSNITISGQAFEGHADVVWKSPPLVLDLKWGVARYTEKLKSGTHLQLSAYAAMNAGGGALPETAYFSLLRQKVMAEPNGLLHPEAHAPGVHTAQAVWQACVPAFEQRRNELAVGRLHASGAEGPDQASALQGATLLMAASCGYCDFHGLCGRGAAQ